jgi:Mg2+-importing ATPase
MVYFGLISTFYDLVLIFSLLYFFNVSTELFRTAWFVESALSEILVTFAIRSRFPFYKSKPSNWLIGSSILTLIFIIGITYLGIGGFLFEFVQMPLTVVLLIASVLIAYFITVEFVKRFFFIKNAEADF